MLKTEQRTLLLLSAQRSLLGRITSPIRNIQVDLVDNALRLFCIHEGTADDALEDEMNAACGEILGDHPAGFFDELKLIRCDAPASCPQLGIPVYQRKEV